MAHATAALARVLSACGSVTTVGQGNGKGMLSTEPEPQPTGMAGADAFGQTSHGPIPGGEALLVSPGASTLLLGECDFSFAVALTTAHDLGAKLWASAQAATEDKGPGAETKLGKCLRKNVKLLRKRGVVVKFGVDATAITATLTSGPSHVPGPAVSNMQSSELSTLPSRWDRVLFCFPRAASLPGVHPDNTALMRGFFASARPLLSETGMIVVLLHICYVHGMAADQWHDWGVAQLAADEGLQRVAVRVWEPRDYPQYQPRAVGGKPFAPGGRRGAEATEAGGGAPPAALWHFLAPTCKGTKSVRGITDRRNFKRLQRHAFSAGGRPRPAETAVQAAVARGLAPWQITCELRHAKLKTPECVFYYDGFLARAEADALYAEFKESLRWETKARNNRMTAYYCELPRGASSAGDESQLAQKTQPGGTSTLFAPWTPPLVRIKARVEQWYAEQTGVSVQFNVCVGNFYADGEHSIGKHTDFEEFGRSTPIASLSLGASRKFLLRSATDREDSAWVALANGSLMVMENLCQHRYVHSVPRDPAVKEGRINLTFRAAPTEYLLSRQKNYF